MSESPAKTTELTVSEESEQNNAQVEVTNEKKPILAIVIAVLLLIGLIVGLFFLARAEGQVVSQVL